jgi:hypothetical protein
MWSDDPPRDWDRHCAEQEKQHAAWAATRPECTKCRNGVIDEEGQCINCGCGISNDDIRVIEDLFSIWGEAERDEEDYREYFISQVKKIEPHLEKKGNVFIPIPPWTGVKSGFIDTIEEQVKEIEGLAETYGIALKE